MSFDRRNFLASAVLGLDVFRRQAALFDFKQHTDISREPMTDIPNIPLTSHLRVEADGFTCSIAKRVQRTLRSSSCSTDSPLYEAFHKDIPNATVKFLPTGHFALETHLAEIVIRQFLKEHNQNGAIVRRTCCFRSRSMRQRVS